MGVLGIRVTRKRLVPPLPAVHFRVFLDRVEIGIRSLGPLHWLAGEAADPGIRQQVVLRRAAGQDRALYDWHRAVASGEDDARTLTIVQLDRPDGAAINIWQLEKASPVRWTGPAFDALTGGMADEEIEVRFASIAWPSSA